MVAPPKGDAETDSMSISRGELREDEVVAAAGARSGGGNADGEVGDVEEVASGCREAPVRRGGTKVRGSIPPTAFTRPRR